MTTLASIQVLPEQYTTIELVLGLALREARKAKHHDYRLTPSRIEDALALVRDNTTWEDV